MAYIGAFISGCSGPALTQDEFDFFRETQPWGLILFRRNCETPEQLKLLTERFRSAVGRKDAPVLIDQEGGRVQRMGPPSNAWRQYPPARRFGEVFEKDKLTALRSARNVARLMAEDLAAAGISVNCLPVLDVPQPEADAIIGDRAYSLKGEHVMALARAHAAGFMDGGVLPVIKHIPGHGRATVDSHLALPVVGASAAELAASDFPPFAAFADAPMAMTAHVVYTAFDRHAPATQSRKVIKRIIRGMIGFRGLLMTDDLSMMALAGSFTEKVQRSLAAGCDIALYCKSDLPDMRDVAKAAGQLKGAPLRRAKAALKWRRKPQHFDRKAALQDLESLVSG